MTTKASVPIDYCLVNGRSANRFRKTVCERRRALTSRDYGTSASSQQDCCCSARGGRTCSARRCRKAASDTEPAAKRPRSAAQNVVRHPTAASKAGDPTCFTRSTTLPRRTMNSFFSFFFFLNFSQVSFYTSTAVAI